jgi:hypothetical protein
MPSPLPQSATISATMALDALAEQSHLVTLAKIKTALEQSIRDDLIRDLRAIKTPEAKLMRITGLGRDSISRIAHSPSKTYQLNEEYEAALREHPLITHSNTGTRNQ